MEYQIVTIVLRLLITSGEVDADLAALLLIAIQHGFISNVKPERQFSQLYIY